MFNFLFAVLKMFVVTINLLIYLVWKHFVHTDLVHEEFLEKGVWRWIPVDHTFVFDCELLCGDMDESKTVDEILSVFEMACSLFVLTLA